MSQNEELTSPLREQASRVATTRYAPVAKEWDRERGLFPADERRYLASLGYLGMTLPEEFGGAGASLLDALAVLEEFAKRNLSAAFQIFEANTGPIRVIELFGSEDQKETYLKAVASGE